jgi:ArsR family transcriptional regulator
MSNATPAIFDRMSALADATRSRILLLLERHELTVGEACQVLQLPQSTVSRHLKLLSDDGWVASRAEGTSRRYRMAADALDESARGLWRIVREPVAALPAAEQDATRLRSVLAQRTTRSRAFFSSSAGQWDRLRAELFGDRTDLLGLLALLPDAWTVGDLGCGTGRLSEALAPFVRRVVAVDASAAMLEAARARLAGTSNVEVRAGELESLPVADGELDAAVASLVLHYLADPEAALAEAFRALRPGGRLVVVDMMPHDREEFRHTMGHVWPGFGAEQMAQWLDAAGFEAPRHLALPPDTAARGPMLFVVSARRPE